MNLRRVGSEKATGRLSQFVLCSGVPVEDSQRVSLPYPT